MPHQVVYSDEEPQAQAQESESHEDSNSASRKRIQKPSTKQKEIGKIFYTRTAHFANKFFPVLCRPGKSRS